MMTDRRVARPTLQAIATAVLRFLVVGTLLVGTAACGSDASGLFTVEGTTAIMQGEIGSDTPSDLRSLLDDHPDVDTIEMVNVPGSGDDQANLTASRLVHSSGLATHVPADGEIASGGVDFFLAGASRSYADGARFGVHSWATGDGIEGIDLATDDPEHDLYLDYYREVGVAEDFYWFTLQAAPANDIHWMTPDELDTYRFAR